MSNVSFAGQSDDVEAIYVFMKNPVPKTTEATTIRQQFLDWYSKAGFWDKSMSSDWYDEARTRRNQFNLKNATTPQQAAQVKAVLSQGLTTEQMQGKTRPTINIKTGAVGSQNKSSTTPGKTLNRILKKGVSGDDVKTWQSFLGLTPPTGYFDSPTDTKTRTWQKANGLTVDGLVGPKSWSKAFGAVDAPFAQTATVTNIASAFKAPQIPTTAQFTPPSKGNAAATAPASILTTQASMLPNLSKVPLWAKITGGVAMAAAAIFGIKHFEHRS